MVEQEVGPEAEIDPVDVVVGVSADVLEVVAGVSRRAGRALSPVGRLVLRPRALPRQLQPGHWLETVSHQGGAQRARLRAELSERLDVVVPVVLAEVVRRARLTDVVLRYVDLDRVVAAADLDAVLDRIDLTTVVLQRVDLDAIVQAVLDRIDLVGIAADVIDGVDLPEIIRESTGTMASDTVREVRMQGIVADEAVSRAVDRLLLRRRRRSAPAQGAVPTPGRPDHPR